MKRCFLPKISIILFLLACLSSCKPGQSGTQSDVINSLRATRVMLPNGWSLTTPGKSLSLGDLPLNVAVSSSGKWMAFTNNGQGTQSITLINRADETVSDEITIPKSWVGLAFSGDEKGLFASGGNDNLVRIYQNKDGKLSETGQIVLGEPWPKQSISPAGLCLDDEAQRLYVVTKDDSALYTCDAVTRQVLRREHLPAEAYTCVLSPDKSLLYISLWGGEKVLLYDLKKRTTSGSVAVGSHPNDMVLTRDGRYLFVANGNENTVSVIEVAARRVVETLTTSLFPDAPAGSTPNGLALSEDEKTLYIANADNNCLSVFDVSERGESRSLGLIPTGWYPTTVREVDGKIYVANGKGLTSLANPGGPQPTMTAAERAKAEYIGSLFQGNLSIISKPDDNLLAGYTQLVYENTPYTKERESTSEGQKGNPIPRTVGDPSPIKYVFYIIKENRTYDQIFGDMSEGNGDASLCLFPENNTPNHHALAREFVLLDNFYVNAEVSADGHNWSMAGYATDFVEKTWPTSYGGRGGTYDYEGTRQVAHPKEGFIWDYCQRAGVSYRTYGEFTSQGKPNLKVLEGHYDPNYHGYDLSYKDVDREAAWEKDFDALVAANAVPHFNTVRISNDHTSGMRIGAPTPQAAVADNDLALGRFVEHLSKSPIWKESVVFVVEDDAQNGPDHVDAHRSVALVIGPYVKRNYVDHTMYSTTSLLRTMELILALPPMSQYDAAATPLWRSFTAQPDARLYTARANNVPLDQRNVAVNKHSIRSGELNLTVPDAINDVEFSEIVWKAVKGIDSPMPAPRRSTFVWAKPEDEEGEGDFDDD
ncbi:bifunctional YncE family protein/alkaline phosphatase family protein [Salmonirosea aquatica]|uniref:Beta-propeller fold lactonase family protein n=1 Tax=Salmonirosea aquatica TaxID=2654236 RepID=A0A7C9FRY5_9BACT|nr:beta-propeller fold lactonase family protein [Cytophagaceae bacterium SJW1-29]